MPKEMCTGGLMFSRKLINFEQYQQVINLTREMLLNGKLSYLLGVN